MDQAEVLQAHTRKTGARALSPAAHAGNGRNRLTTGNGQTEEIELRVAELRRQLHNLEGENEKLRVTMREMADDYSR